jgi:inner membrane protein
VVVYESELSLTGIFKIPHEVLNSEGRQHVTQHPFYLKLGLSDLRGIRDIVIHANGTLIEELPGLPHKSLTDQGIHVPLLGEWIHEEEISFDIHVKLNGSSDIRFTPVGKNNQVSLSSPWKDPSFNGSFLPESKEISQEGFSAHWSINYLNRNYPQYWWDVSPDVTPSQFGVHFLIPVDHYQKSMRSIKYAFMFIALTFLIFFLTEIITGSRLHPIQYLLAGTALVVFFTLLISLAEHTGFNLAYIISSLATTTLIGLYVRSSTGSWKQGLITWILLVTIYAFLFTTLQLEDYSLLFGSVGIFLVVGIIMYVSRKVNWYRETSSDMEKQT